MDFESKEIVYEDYENETTAYPYLPGFLAFKEVPAYTILFERLKQNSPEMWPDLLMVDGNGLLHTRSCGVACHVGVLFDLPSIGVGKTVFAVDGLTQVGVKELSAQNLNKAGDFVNLVGDSGKVWGASLRATNESKVPLIVSIGHRVDLQTAIDITIACIGKFRIPEPIR